MEMASLKKNKSTYQLTVEKNVTNSGNITKGFVVDGALPSEKVEINTLFDVKTSGKHWQTFTFHFMTMYSASSSTRALTHLAPRLKIEKN